MSAIWFAVLLLGSTGRLTRLVNRDHIAGGLRARVITRYGPDSMPALFVACPWCVSIWVAAVVVPVGHLVYYAEPWHRPGDVWDGLASFVGVFFIVVAMVLTLSYAVGLLSTLDDAD